MLHIHMQLTVYGEIGALFYLTSPLFILVEDRKISSLLSWTFLPLFPVCMVLRRERAASTPVDRSCFLTVVNGGAMVRAKKESLLPMTDTSSGIVKLLDFKAS